MENNDGITQKAVKDLLDLLSGRLHDNLNEMRRPLVIEFAGTPKAGKTTCVNAIAKFLRRQQIAVHIVTERASVCPLVDKRHPYFNIWTASMSLAQMLEALEKKVSVVILDRGLFDSKVWMDFHFSNNAITQEEMQCINSFLMLDRFLSPVDLVVALQVTPEQAMAREFKEQIIDLPGSIMNADTLASYNESLERTIEAYSRNFRLLISVDTTSKPPARGVADIAENVLRAVDDLLDERVAVVNREIVAGAMRGQVLIRGPEQIVHLLEAIYKQFRWKKRSEAEKDISLVQLVPVATFFHDKEVLVTLIRGVKQGHLVDKHTTWVGGHSRHTDLPKGAHRQTLLRRTLAREIAEELRIAIDKDELPVLPSAVIWDDADVKSAQHLGVFYGTDLPRRIPKQRLHLREISEMPNKWLFTQFFPLGEPLKGLKPWERWSKHFLREVCGIDLGREPEQRPLFDLPTNAGSNSTALQQAPAEPFRSGRE